MKCTLAALIISAAVQLYAFDAEITSDRTDRVRLSGLRCIEDRDRTLTIKEIINSADWEIIKSDSISRGFSSSAFWFKFTVNNSSGRDLPYLLEISYPLLDCIDLYLPDRAGNYTLKQGGDHYPFSKREVRDSPDNIFRLTVLPGIHNYYFRVESTSSIHFTVQLLSENAHANKPFNPEIIFYILLILILVINVLYLIVKKIFSHNTLCVIPAPLLKRIVTGRV